nr:DUF1365 domain-containing protein [Candidatus Omnitrophota bacterium]
MNSKVYTGRVTHHRLLPVKNSFSYPYYFYAFDLDELHTLGKTVRGFGYNRVTIASIHDKDYLTQEKGTIKEKLFSLLAREDLASGIEKVMLVTSAKYFNHIFNPVSFYYCYGPGHELQCVVAEVNNTFGERYVYILKKPFNGNARYFASSRAEKKFFVSPFFTVEGEYFFYLSDI